MRIQRDLARHRGARWTHQFRPQLNDLVNESFKMGCDPSSLQNAMPKLNACSIARVAMECTYMYFNVTNLTFE